jgi:hypothetical protein
MWFAKNMVDYFSWVAKEQAPSVNILFAWQFVVSLCLSKEPRRQADWWNCQIKCCKWMIQEDSRFLLSLCFALYTCCQLAVWSPPAGCGQLWNWIWWGRGGQLEYVTLCKTAPDLMVHHG